jgi:hypothetical protein
MGIFKRHQRLAQATYLGKFADKFPCLAKWADNFAFHYVHLACTNAREQPTYAFLLLAVIKRTG